MYKNALGRSDAAHIRESHDMPILINVFFILNYLLIFFEKKVFLKKFFSYKTFVSLSIFFLIFYYIFNHNNYQIGNIKNYKRNFANFINLEDEVFLDQNTIKLINSYKQLSEEDGCIVNITYEIDSISYLVKKPSCTKYWSAWLASPIASQKNYINEIKKIEPKYILYQPKGAFDELELSERIELLSSYILSNYKKYDELGNYIINGSEIIVLEKK